MIPRFTKVQLIRDDVWLVWIDEGVPFKPPAQRLVAAIDPPLSCLGGVWCSHFGCKDLFESKGGGMYERRSTQL